MSPTKLQMEVTQDRTLITRESVAKRILEVVITAPETASRPDSLPLNTDAAVATLDVIITKYRAMLGPQKTAELMQLRTSIHDRTLSVLESKARHHTVYSVRASRAKQ